MIKPSELPDGTHFWANLDGRLVMIGKFRDEYSVCGPWECGISEESFEIIEIVAIPEGHKFETLYYY